MKRDIALGEFEQVVLLAILRIQQQGAYGLSIREVISEKTCRIPSTGAVYTTLERLEEKKLVRSKLGEATAERGGRAKRFYHVTASGEAALQQSREEYENLVQGLSLFGEQHA